MLKRAAICYHIRIRWQRVIWEENISQNFEISAGAYDNAPFQKGLAKSDRHDVRLRGQVRIVVVL